MNEQELYALESMRRVLRSGYQRSWITSRDGNVSWRNIESDYFYISPSGVRKQELQTRHFKKIQASDSLDAIQSNWPPVWHDLAPSEQGSGLAPSGEVNLHAGLLVKGRGFWSTRSVLHLHPPQTVAAMIAGVSLNRLNEQFPELRYTRIGGQVPSLAASSLELAVASHSAFGTEANETFSVDIIGLENHGVVAIGSDPYAALEHIERLEHVCGIVLCSGKVELFG